MPRQVHFQQLATSEPPAACAHDKPGDPHPALVDQARSLNAAEAHQQRDAPVNPLGLEGRRDGKAQELARCVDVIAGQGEPPLAEKRKPGSQPPSRRR